MKSVYDPGSFGQILEADDNYTQKKTSFSPFKKFFRSPTVMVFGIIAIIECVLLLLIAAATV